MNQYITILSLNLEHPKNLLLKIYMHEVASRLPTGKQLANALPFHHELKQQHALSH